MRKYNYNERLVKELNITPFIKKYNFNNEEYNTAIFCALSSVYSHTLSKEGVTSKSILLGDYYSFEYYSLLKNSLDKLANLSDTMKSGYFQVVTGKIDLEEFYFSIIKTWFSFYDVEFNESDSKLITFI